LTSPETNPDTPTRAPSRRALRTMAVVRWVLLALVTLLAVTSVVTVLRSSEEQHADHAVDRYYCPMHPEVRSSEPGECPICHMDLVPIPEARQSTAPAGGAHVHGSEGVPSVSAVSLSAQKQEAVGLRTSPVESATLGDRLRVPGVLSAPETGRSEVRVRAPGFVERVAVRQSGVKVSAGQPLAFIYSPDIYRAQEEFLALSRWNAAPTLEGQSSTATADMASAARRGLELLGLSQADIAELVRTGEPMRAIPVRAPAGGFVMRTSAVLGSRADPEMVLYEIADLSSLWVIASVHERDLAAVQVGTTARFLMNRPGAEPLVGKVDLVEPLLEESTRSARVRLVLKNEGLLLRPGQYGEVEFELPATPGLFVPGDAVIRTGQYDYVYVQTEPDRFEPRRVTTGSSRDGRVQVLSGVAAGERVVTRGSFMLDSESRLKASLEAGPSSPEAVPAAQPAGGTGAAGGVQ